MNRNDLKKRILSYLNYEAINGVVTNKKLAQDLGIHEDVIYGCCIALDREKYVHLSKTHVSISIQGKFFIETGGYVDEQGTGHTFNDNSINVGGDFKGTANTGNNSSNKTTFNHNKKKKIPFWQKMVLGLAGSLITGIPLVCNYMDKQDQRHLEMQQGKEAAESRARLDSILTNSKMNEVEGSITDSKAGRDINQNIQKFDVKGNVYLDSSKNTVINNYAMVKPRELDLKLMEKIIDSIPSKNTKIHIMCGGNGEPENLGIKMKKYLKQKGFTDIVIGGWTLTGDFDKIEYSYADNLFTIGVHPQREIPKESE